MMVRNASLQCKQLAEGINLCYFSTNKIHFNTIKYIVCNPKNVKVHHEMMSHTLESEVLKKMVGE